MLTPPDPSPGARSRLLARLFAPVDLASLAVFRILFGSILLWEAGRYLTKGWVHRYYVEPDFHFRYYGFEWVHPLPGPWMHALFVALGALGACIALGLCYRLAAALFFVGFTYVFLLDQAQYLNHLYLVCALSFALVFLPLHRTASLDARLRPSLGADRGSGWPLHFLRGFLVLVYTFAGIAKLNADWLRAQPLLLWLEAHRDAPLVGPFLAHDATAWLMSYAGLAFDLLIGPALLWRRTRPLAIVAALAFHMSNAALFEIGIFPWLMAGTTLLFLDPDWPRRAGLLPRAGSREAPAPTGRARSLLVAGLAAWFGAHTLVPLRHHLYPGDVSWTEEGHRFAWHMKLRTKRGKASFRVVDLDSGASRRVRPDTLLTSRQAKKMATHPDMILQFAHHLAERARADGVARVAVYADVTAGLNARRPERLVDPTVDLAAEPRRLGPTPWILGFTRPLPSWEDLRVSSAAE